MQTILGSGGAIGTELAKALKAYTSDIKLVSRNPKQVNETDHLFAADLADKVQVSKAVEGSEVCYLTIGFTYNLKTWQEKWPGLIRNVVDACTTHKAKLVFFDNVYAIGGNGVKHITEKSPISPSSKKGAIRAQVDKYIIEHVEKGKINAIIARSPDFFGPMKENSILMNLVYDNLLKGKTAQWFCNAGVMHTNGFVPDLAKGTGMVGNSPDAFNQIWNLPVDKEALTGREWVRLFADEMGTNNKVQVLSSWGVRFLGLFIPILREMAEMLYQYDRDYYFDSTKFQARFNFIPTTNREAVRQTVDKLRKNVGL